LEAEHGTTDTVAGDRLGYEERAGEQVQAAYAQAGYLREAEPQHGAEVDHRSVLLRRCVGERRDLRRCRNPPRTHVDPRKLHAAAGRPCEPVGSDGASEHGKYDAVRANDGPRGEMGGQVVNEGLKLGGSNTHDPMRPN
jgi:hypothetical protein